MHAALIDGIILGDTRISATQFYEGFEREGSQLRIGYRQICEQFKVRYWPKPFGVWVLGKLLLLFL